MSNFNEQDQNPTDPINKPIDSEDVKSQSEPASHSKERSMVESSPAGVPLHEQKGGETGGEIINREGPSYGGGTSSGQATSPSGGPPSEGRPVERGKVPGRTGARGTAAMDPQTRQEVARKGGLAVSRNKQHMAEIGRKGGQSVSKNREHMAQIGRKGGAASRGHR